MKSIKKLTLQKNTVRTLNLRSGLRTGANHWSVVTVDPESTPSGAHKQCSGHTGPPSANENQ